MEIVCTFINGSQAQGCIIMLEKISEATTELNLKITKGNSTLTARNTIQVTSTIVDLICNHNYALHAYDIEADRSSGTVPIPVSLKISSSTMCPAHGSGIK